MAKIVFEDVLKAIRNKSFHKIYLLMGEESFYIDVIADYLEQTVLTDGEKEFNLTILYGKDTDIPSIISHARRYPMMASHHLVIIREAQQLKDLEELSSYAERPLDSTILVICHKYGSVDKRKKLCKDIAKNGLIFEGKKLYENQVAGWIGDYIKRKGFRAGPQAVQLLADHLGSDLSKIVNEISKLFINLKKGEEITPSVIEQQIGISKDYNVFEFRQAIGSKNEPKAQKIAWYFGENLKANPLVFTLSALFQYFNQILVLHSLKDKSKRNIAESLGIPPFFTEDYIRAASNYPGTKAARAISLIRQYDLKGKGMDNESVGGGELLKELTYRILHL